MPYADADKEQLVEALLQKDSIGRGTGRTTRMVDAAVEYLLKHNRPILVVTHTHSLGNVILGKIKTKFFAVRGQELPGYLISMCTPMTKRQTDWEVFEDHYSLLERACEAIRRL